MLQTKRKQFDGLLLIIYLNLVIIGLLMIYSSSHGPGETPDIFDLKSPLGRQLLWAGVSLVTLLFLLTISSEFWKTFAVPIYILAIIGLILVLIFGSEIKGAKAWFSIGIFSFQPAEFAKLGTLLLVSSFLSNFRTDIRQLRHQGVGLLILLLPVLLILLQPDAGSGLIFLAFLLPMFRGGLPIGYLILGVLVFFSFLMPLIMDIQLWLYGILFISLTTVMLSFEKKRFWIMSIILLVVLSYLGYREELFLVMTLLLCSFFLLFGILAWRQGRQRLVSLVLSFMILSSILSYSSFFIFNNLLLPHQQERINVWLNPEKCDPRGSLYNVLQAKLAISSGGLEGKGFLEGNITKLHYVPEQTTDFIFCAIGEEQGFIGTFGVIILYMMLVLRIIQIGERQRTEFGRYYAYGLAGMFFLHYTINIGMTIGLAPVIGIPLPFISYGGSSLLFFTILLGILMKLDYSDRSR